MPTPRLDLVILAVEDLDRAVRFYTQAFGWNITVRVPVYVECKLPDGMRFGLYQRDGFARNTGRTTVACPPDRTTATELYLHVDDIDAMGRSLEGLGAECLSAKALRPWGDEATYYRDPDGNVVVLARPAPRG
ncbi:MAG: VOC family protein [Planctomycetes bacterium]|nr:VOC family protein [Planctomycetota bacterium]